MRPPGSDQVMREVFVNLRDPLGAQTLRRIERNSHSGMSDRMRKTIGSPSHPSLSQREKEAPNWEEGEAKAGRRGSSDACHWPMGR